MPKKKPHPIADQFSDDQLNQIKHYGEALGGKPTSFDEEVERHLEHHERNYAKMRSGCGETSANRRLSLVHPSHQLNQYSGR